MNIADIKQAVEQDDEGAVVTIYQRNEEPYRAADGSESTVTVVGSESKRYKAAKHAYQRRLMKIARHGGGRLTPEDSDAEALRLTASAVIAWHGWEEDGKPMECTTENVLKILAFDHINEQVNAAIQRHAAFFESKSSS